MTLAGHSGQVTRRLVPLWLVLATTGGLFATGTLDAAPSGAPEVGTARVAFNDSTIESAEYADGVDLVASYGVTDDRLRADTGLDPEHVALWATVIDDIPVRLRPAIRQFSVVEQGAGSTVAMVHQSGLDPERWLLSVDIADADNESLIRDTVVHELVHLITLGPDQFTFNHRLIGPCDGVAVEVGCAHPESILARWSTQFWSDPSRATVFDPTAFVAHYAATGPHEDLAETVLFWTRGDTGGDDLVLAAKFAFVENEPALRELRPA